MFDREMVFFKPIELKNLIKKKKKKKTTHQKEKKPLKRELM